jgi:tRNA1(Val) A37 N6-methylase TrmN6
MENNYEVFGLNRIKLYISKEHRFGTDSLLLGEFVRKGRTLKNRTVCDLCTGCGVIPVMLCSQSPAPALCYAVEIQPEAAELLHRTVTENSLNIKIIQGDLRSQETLSQIPRESIDTVTANPPYYPINSGYERKSEAQKTARYDEHCKLEDVIKAAVCLLKFGGELKMCMAADRLTDCIYTMRESGIEPKIIEFISGKINARLFLISGKKGGKPGVKITWT